MALKRRPFAKIGAILKGIAPTAVAALGGPYAPLIANVMKRAMGDEGMTDEQLESAIVAASSSPADIAKLREIELEAQRQEELIGVRFAELEVEDRKDARHLAIETNFWPQVTLSVIFVVGYFIVLALFFTGETSVVPMSDAFMVMLGVLTAGVPQVLAFWLGSSSGSTKKNDLMAKLASER